MRRMTTVPAPAPPPRLPRDYGMTGLGLLMQVFGGMWIAFNAIFVITAFQIPGGANKLMGLAIIVSGIVRSSMHYSAGGKLATSAPDGWIATRRYALFGLAQSLAVAIMVVVMVGSFQMGPTLWIFLALASWPAMVLVVLRRGSLKQAYEAAYEGDRPVWPRDRGLHGAGVLMATLGLLGCCFSALLLILIIPQAGTLIKVGGFTGMVTLALVALLTVRAIIHFTGGLTGLRAEWVDFITGINRYFTWAMISVALFVVWGFTLMASLGGSSLQVLGIGVALLLLWPASLVGITKKIPWDMDDVGAPNGKAVDGGLSALGYLLLALGIYSLVVALAPLMMTGMGGLLGSSLGAAFAQDLPTWLGIIGSLINLWAGFELATMSERFKVAGTVYGVVGIGMALYSAFQMFSMGGGGLGMAGASGLFMYAVVGAQLALPIMTLWLANRPLPKVTDYAEVFE